MDITQLRYFLKTADLLNYTKAAECLFITRQSLRQAVASMEKELGIPLFINEKNRLSLTEYGEYLQLKGRDVVNSFDQMMENVNHLAACQDVLRVAFSVCLFPFMLGDTEVILRMFRSRFPHIRMEVSYLTNDAVIDAVQQGEVDCGCIIQMPRRHPGCTMQVLKTFDAAVSYGEGSPLYGRREITLEELEGIPCIGMGSLEKTLHSVWEECQIKGIQLAYEIVPNTIDAFYKIQNNLAVGFDILMTDVPQFDRDCLGALRGHEWEIGFFTNDASRKKQALDLFCSFCKKEYESHWNTYAKEWNCGLSDQEE